VDITIKDATSDPLASKTTCEVSIISNATDNSLNASHASPSPIYTSLIDSRARLDAAASKISIDTTSTVPYKENQALNASYISASASLAIFIDSIPAYIKGRLILPPILF